MNILITGGSGFIGTNLINFYIKQNSYKIINLDIVPPRDMNHLSFWRRCDINNFTDLKKKYSEFMPDYIFHLAARTDLDGVCLEDYKSNIKGVKNLLEIISLDKKINRVIFASTRLVCKIGYLPKSDIDYLPSTVYGQSKVIGEGLVRKYKNLLPCTSLIVRPTSIWGEWFDVPYKNFFMSIFNRRYFHPTGKSIYKSFGYVQNTVYQLDKLMFCDSRLVSNKLFYLADYPPIELGNFADKIKFEYAGDFNKRLNRTSLYILASFFELIKLFGYKNPPLTFFRLNNLLCNMIYDLRPLKSIVGELPYDLNLSIKNTIKWLEAN
jgi:hypothetical protein